MARYILFTIIFVVYFSSSVGLMNSMDTPQFFTTEALLKNKNIDMRAFENDPHFFIWPDYFIKSAEMLNQRGYLLSIIGMPIHIISGPFSKYVNISNFSIDNSTNLKYELLISSLFTIFSVLGLIFTYFLIGKITKNSFISILITVVLAFGTYTWKYSSTYARQGLLVFMISIFLWVLYDIIFDKRSAIKLVILWLVWSISFGVDLGLFLALTVILIQLLLLLLITKKPLKRKEAICTVAISFFVIGLNIFFNFKYYNTFTFLQYDKNIVVRESFRNMETTDKINRMLTSTPIFPTLINVLFSYKQLPTNQFIYFNTVPQEIKKYLSFDYAKKYPFYGIFTISPLFIVSIFSFLIKKNKKLDIFLLLSLELFILGILSNLKTIAFWGGNQYDVRYFYPYVLVLAPLTAVVLQYIFIKMTGILKWLAIMSVSILSIFSLFMGWLGVINMYMPSLNGERRIWMDLNILKDKFFLHTSFEYLNATFMNRDNAWIAMSICFFIYFIYLIISLFMNFFKRNDQYFSSSTFQVKEK